VEEDWGGERNSRNVLDLVGAKGEKLGPFVKGSKKESPDGALTRGGHLSFWLEATKAKKKGEGPREEKRCLLSVRKKKRKQPA